MYKSNIINLFLSWCSRVAQKAGPRKKNGDMAEILHQRDLAKGKGETSGPALDTFGTVQRTLGYRIAVPSSDPHDKALEPPTICTTNSFRPIRWSAAGQQQQLNSKRGRQKRKIEHVSRRIVNENFLWKQGSNGLKKIINNELPKLFTRVNHYDD